jgi:hypothetical protein
VGTVERVTEGGASPGWPAGNAPLRLLIGGTIGPLSRQEHDGPAWHLCWQRVDALGFGTGIKKGSVGQQSSVERN